ncbi:MAG: hypothetical protein GX929_09475 [Clostridiales bacterium]|nr:hypothetical protein [Clostridiales bacterium]
MRKCAYKKRLKLLKHARAILRDLSPLQTDCGMLCGGACCKGGDGMWLLPGEAAFYGDDEKLTVEPGLPAGDAHPEREPYDFLACTYEGGGCDRDTRPLSCRIFPYFPCVTRTAGGRYRVRARIDPRAVKVCPLLRDGAPGMEKRFRHGVERAGRVLLRDTRTREFLENTTDELTELARLL